MVQHLPIACVVPARLNSSRLSRKLLLDLHGHPVIYHTLQKALECDIFSQVYCVIDSIEIKQVLEGLSCQVILSPEACNGTERIAKCLSQINEPLILNLQGDEPVMKPSILKSFAKNILTDPTKCWVSGHSCSDTQDLENPSRVKILLKNQKIVDFVRKIPVGWNESIMIQTGLYGYSQELLKEYLGLSVSVREIVESHEILRWNTFFNFRLSILSEKSLSLDTKEDWYKIQNFLY